MPLEHERAFSADSPVGRYWLRNCVGFRVDGLLGGAGVVEEVGLGHDGVDVLAVRRRGVVLGRRVLVPTERVQSVHPWDDTIVLASRRRRARSRRAAQAQRLTRQVQPAGRAVALESARAVRDGAIVVLRLLAAFGTLLLGLGVFVRERAPHVRRHASRFTTAVKVIASAYATEARRGWRAEREAIAAWREGRRNPGEEPGDDAPLTRAGAEEVDARRQESARRLDRAPAGDQADDEHDQRDDEQQPQEVRYPDAAADREEKQQHDHYQQQW
jgi:hypothetical protein